MINYQQTIINQYANSPSILQLIDNVNQWIDQYPNFQKFYERIWNIDMADTYGLDVWGRILGISRRFITISEGAFFGFSGNDPDYQPFNQAPFYNSIGDVSTSLNNDDFRRVLLTKAFINISPVTAQNINRALNMLFVGRGVCYVVDLGNMAIQYTFEFALSNLDRAILTQIMPSPCGVAVSINEV